MYTCLFSGSGAFASLLFFTLTLSRTFNVGCKERTTDLFPQLKAANPQVRVKNNDFDHLHGSYTRILTLLG